METALTTVVGLLGGLALSIAFWYWITHRIIPTITFSDDISLLTAGIEGEQDYVRYRIKMANTSNRRAAIDVTVRVRLLYKDLPGVTKGTTTSITLPPYVDHIMCISPGKKFVVSVLPSSDWLTGHEKQFPQSIHEKVRAGASDALEELMKYRESTVLVLQVLCYDQWSGSRRYFRSKDYTYSDIKRGGFDEMRVRVEG